VRIVIEVRSGTVQNVMVSSTIKSAVEKVGFEEPINIELFDFDNRDGDIISIVPRTPWNEEYHKELLSLVEMRKTLNKEYIGDSVYAEIEDGMLKLTVSNDEEDSETIYLNSDVCNNLLEYIKNNSAEIV
jgi:hypothetical protein